MREVRKRVGEVSVGWVSEGLTLVTGTLDVGQVKSPAVIGAARRAGAALASDLVVLDAPPGVACSAVASIRGADALLLVTEPTPFGLHDLELSLRLGADLGIPTAVFLNREGLGSAGADSLCAAWRVPIAARLAFDRTVAETYARGEMVVERLPAVRAVLEPVIGVMEEIVANSQRQAS